MPDNSQIDGTYSLNFYILSSLVAEGSRVFLRETRYEFDQFQLSDNRSLHNVANILAIIYQGILDSIIRPEFSIHLAEINFVPGLDLTIVIVPEEHKIEFHGLDGHYFSISFNNNNNNNNSTNGGTSIELGELGLLLVQKKRQYNILHITSKPSQKPIQQGRDFIEYLHAQILRNQLLVESLRLVAGFRYFYKYKMPIVIHVKDSSDMLALVS